MERRGIVKAPYRYRPEDYPDDPWWHVGITPADSVRYARAVRLSQFKRDVKRGVTPLRKQRLLDYRQRCIDNWQRYMETGTAL
jgi:hypothetical protein